MKINIYIILTLISFSKVELISEIKWQQTRPSHWLQENRPIVCLDSTDCINLGEWDNKKMILRSTDGGFTWKTLYWEDWDPQINYFLSGVNISYPAKNHIYISCNRMTILRTKDNFKTLDTIVLPSKYTNDGYYNYIRSITMLDTLFGTASTLGYVYLTRDGWKTYEELSRFDELKPDSNYNLSYGRPYGSQVYLFDSLNFFIYLNISKRTGETTSIRRTGIVRTNDGGKSWYFFELCNSKESGDLEIGIDDFFFINQKVGFALGDDNLDRSLIYKTTDGGLTWLKKFEDELGESTNLLEIAFSDEMNGIAVGKFGEVRTTYDGGETWVNETFAKDYDERMERIVQFVAYAGNSPIISTFTGGIWRGTYHPTSVEDKKSNGSIISPNPSSDYINITLPENMYSNPTLKHGVDNVVENVQIFNMLGVEVINSVSYAATPQDGNVRIDVSHLPACVYYVRIIGSNGASSIIEKFLKI